MKKLRKKTKVNWDLVVGHLNVCADVAERLAPRSPQVSIDELVWGPGINTLMRCSRAWKPDGAANFSTYLRVSLGRSMSRFISKQKHITLGPSVEVDDNDFCLLQIESKLDAYNILERVNMFDRVVLLMRYIQGMTYVEMAEELGCSGSTAFKYEREAIENCRLAMGI